MVPSPSWLLYSCGASDVSIDSTTILTCFVDYIGNDLLAGDFAYKLPKGCVLFHI